MLDFKLTIKACLVVLASEPRSRTHHLRTTQGPIKLVAMADAFEDRLWEATSEVGREDTRVG